MMPKKEDIKNRDNMIDMKKEDLIMKTDNMKEKLPVILVIEDMIVMKKEPMIEVMKEDMMRQSEEEVKKDPEEDQSKIMDYDIKLNKYLEISNV
jgi:hypothetical protein